MLAANLNINFRKPVPLEKPITVRGWVERIEGRKIFTAGQIVLEDGAVATEGRGIFVTAPEFVSKIESNPFGKGEAEE